MRRSAVFLVSFAVLATCAQMCWAERVYFQSSNDIGGVINAVLQNEAWTRVLALGVILWLVLQARSDKRWIVAELQEIKEKMVTQEKVDKSSRDLAEEIRSWADDRFLTERESGMRFSEVDRRLAKAGA